MSGAGFLVTLSSRPDGPLPPETAPLPAGTITLDAGRGLRVPSIARVAGRYELGQVIGRGGMAEVHAGLDARLDRPVAIKLLRSDLAGVAAIRQRFESEARLAARLFHPNVVAVFDSGESEEGVPFIVMERLPGSTLQDKLREGPLTLPEAYDLASQVLAALDAAHSAGVLHRDVKPGNILIGPAGQWKVGDFGIAKALEVPGSSTSDTTVLMGTPAYLAPERLQGEPATIQSDLYSFGVVVYEALTARKPLETPLLLGRPDVDPSFAGAIEQCLSADPGRRPASASSVDIGAVAPGGAVAPQSNGAPVDSDLTVSVAVPAPTDILPTPPPPPPPVAVRAPVVGQARHALSHRTRVLLGAVAAIAIALIVIASLPTSHSPSSSTTTTTPSGLPAGLARAVANLEKQVTP